MSNEKKNKFKVSEELETNNEKSEEDLDDINIFKNGIDNIMATDTIRQYLFEAEDGNIYIGPFSPQYINESVERVIHESNRYFDDITQYF